MIKKILLGLLSLILILIICFVAIGFVISDIQYNSTVEINKPRDIVWTILTDRTKSKEWVVGLQSIETISGQPNEIGSKTKIVLNREGRIDEFTRELIDIKSPEKVSTKLESDYVSHELMIELTEVDGKTKLVSSEKLVGKNFFVRSLLPLMKSNIAGLSQKNFESLRKFAESNQ